ncbi:fluoride efflux transporter FluC [Cryptosporangium phraense]|uniref:Fluoride-specific ion channel FluC n=1 Tax=Cryptosporangium phraense TaxID=2593070 RepID=A0A545ANG8_9ACTN|nr:CrcB family protein [Cryptosporangium phraense]TQS42882.1 CrcB family protein [Cryptosporangium phraense]
MSEPTDADVDLAIPAQRRERLWPVLAAVSAGGVLGALARYGITAAWPHGPDGFAWSTFVVNVSGCFLIGVLMVVVTEVYPQRKLLRPFLGVGFLGGYTTFSTYVVDAGRNATAGASAVGLAYLAVTLVGALLAVWAGSALTARLVSR